MPSPKETALITKKIMGGKEDTAAPAYYHPERQTVIDEYLDPTLEYVRLLKLAVKQGRVTTPKEFIKNLEEVQEMLGTAIAELAAGSKL